MSDKISAMLMKKHLRLHNKYVREDLVVSGIAKMKKEELKKKFDRRFTKVGSGDGAYYKSKEYRNFDADIPEKELKELMKKKPKKEKEQKKPKPEPKKIKVKRRVKGGKVVGGSVDGKEI